MEINLGVFGEKQKRFLSDMRQIHTSEISTYGKLSDCSISIDDLTGEVLLIPSRNSINVSRHTFAKAIWNIAKSFADFPFNSKNYKNYLDRDICVSYKRSVYKILHPEKMSMIFSSVNYELELVEHKLPLRDICSICAILNGRNASDIIKEFGEESYRRMSGIFTNPFAEAKFKSIVSHRNELKESLDAKLNEIEGMQNTIINEFITKVKYDMQKKRYELSQEFQPKIDELEKEIDTFEVV